MKYKAKSMIVGRKKRKDSKKDDDARPCFVALFDMNDPHRQSEAPKKIIDFESSHKIMINGSKVLHYLLAGNDLVVNNLKEVEVKEDKGHIVVECVK